LHPAASHPSMAVGPAPAQHRLSSYQVGGAGHPPPRAVPGSDSGSDPELASRARVASGPLAWAPLPYLTPLPHRAAPFPKSPSA
jgi:hypothetical protein